jgi:hypothetical protein
MSFFRHTLTHRRVRPDGSALLVLALALASAGCGSSPEGGGGDGGRADAGSRGDAAAEDDAGSRGDAGGPDAGEPPCPADEAAAIDTPCASEGQICGGPCTDECSFCNLIQCVEGRWQRLEVFPAPCFDCGPSLRCVEYAEYCHVLHGGEEGSGSSYECRDAPDRCEGTAACDCVTVPAGGSCDDSTEGQVTVEEFAP